jgi:hypothetical protein
MPRMKIVLLGFVLISLFSGCAIVKAPDREKGNERFGLPPVHVTKTRYDEALRKRDPILIVGGNGGWWSNTSDQTILPNGFKAGGYAKFGPFDFDAFTVPPGNYKMDVGFIAADGGTVLFIMGGIPIPMPIEGCQLVNVGKVIDGEMVVGGPVLKLSAGDVIYVGHIWQGRGDKGVILKIDDRYQHVLDNIRELHPYWSLPIEKRLLDVTPYQLGQRTDKDVALPGAKSPRNCWVRQASDQARHDRRARLAGE